MDAPPSPPPPAASPAPAAPGAGRRSARAAAALALGGLGLLVGLGALFALWLGRGGLDGGVEAALLGALEALGPAAVVLLMIAHCFIPFPAEILALAAGAAYGTWAGAGLIWAGAMLGAALSFLLARRLGRAAVARLLPARQAAALDAWAADQGATTLLVSRLVPVIAFNLINYAAGLTPVRFSTFLWTTGLGILPLTVAMTWAGASMTELSWPALLAVSGAGILGLWALHAALRRRGREPRR